MKMFIKFQSCFLFVPIDEVLPRDQVVKDAADSKDITLLTDTLLVEELWSYVAGSPTNLRHLLRLGFLE